MANIISIPTPCNEDWNAMTANSLGRHCDSCCKTVVDFTTWQPNDILQYFNEHKNVCGRFNVQQLEEPIPTAEDFVRQISYFNMPTIKKVAAIFIFAFAIGNSAFSANAQGEPITSEVAIVEPETVHGGASPLPTPYTLDFPKQLYLKTTTKNNFELKPAKKSNLFSIKTTKPKANKAKGPYYILGAVSSVEPVKKFGDTIITKILRPPFKNTCTLDTIIKNYIKGKVTIQKEAPISNTKPTDETMSPTMGMVAVRRSNK